MLYFIPTPIGNLNDISKRSLELLQSCEFLICEDTRNTKSLCSLLNQKYELNINPKGFLALHSHNEDLFFKKIDPDIFKQNIAYVSDAGMPGLSDPGVALIRYAKENGLDYEVLPGANAALLAIVASGFCTKEFIFIGFLANKGKQRQSELEKLLLNPYPSIVYESPKRILALVNELAKLEANRELFLIKEATKLHESKYFGKASDVASSLSQANLKGEWVLIIKAQNQDFVKSKLCEDDIMQLDIAPKIKAKLLAKLSGKNPKELYKKLFLS